MQNFNLCLTFLFKDTRCLFNTLESIYVHFSYPTKNQQLIDMQKKLGLKIKTIGKISDTRWNCRYKNCDAVLDCYHLPSNYSCITRRN